jgi:hypothetical protein
MDSGRMTPGHTLLIWLRYFLIELKPFLVRSNAYDVLTKCRRNQNKIKGLSVH